MLYPTLHELTFSEDSATRAAPVAGTLPANLVFSQRAAATFRAALREQGLEDWRIFCGVNFDLDDLDEHLPKLDPRATWQALTCPTAGGEAPQMLWRKGRRAAERSSGWLLLRRHQVALARWYWTGEKAEQLWLLAAPSAEAFGQLHKRVTRLRRKRAACVWQLVSGGSWNDGPRKRRRPLPPDDLVLTDALRQRVEMDVVRFFSPAVAELYRTLGVPYRRGVLLHGPPGNGKTSLIRHVGGALSQVPAMVLRPGSQFDSDDMEEVLRRWRRQAPAMLIIEDLDWLLEERVNVSTFLNLIDGIDNATTGGLLLIATTNNPQKLDPAVSNRPGRFDVVMEVPAPDSGLRRRFLARGLHDLDELILEKVVKKTDGLSFSHLQEILRLSGLLVIRDGRQRRSEEDVLRAAEMVCQGHDDALRGFPPRSGLEFGLQHLQRHRTGTAAG